MNMSEFSTILEKIGGNEPIEYGFPLFKETIVWEDPFREEEICKHFKDDEEKFRIILKINDRVKKWNLEYKREFHVDYLPYYPVRMDVYPMAGDFTIDDKLLYIYATEDENNLPYRYNKTLLEYFDEKIKFETKYKKTDGSNWEKYRNKVLDWFNMKDVDPENVISFFHEKEMNKFETYDELQKIEGTKEKKDEYLKIQIEVPAGTSWKQISIIVFDNEHLIINGPNNEVRIDFANAGFADKRAKDKSKWKPNETWAILLEMAESKMIHKGEHYDILSRCKGEAKQRIYKLNQTLRKLVKIDDNPINRYNRRNGGWIPKFNLIDKRDQIYSSKSEIKKLKRDKKI